ncbi:hypothetical protein RCC89_07400 [Cytophagaceae bacterium ABcell3]|nr:hypothetical protein RCC89_07400 [Cytophagaceae bacterium ABcell3]
MKLIVICLLSVLLFSNSTMSQSSYLYQADLPLVEEAGYYEIKLTPEITGNLSKELHDLRVVSEHGEEVPYILQQDQVQHTKLAFVPYEIVESVSKIKGVSHFIVHNPDKRAVDHVVLRIKNADVDKNLRISGSNDGEQWFVVKGNVFVEGFHEKGRVFIEKKVSFPLSDYEYLKFEMDDSVSAPINVLHAGFYAASVSEGSYMELPAPEVVRYDTLGKTFLDFTFAQRFLLDRIKFSVESPEKYKRKAMLYVNSGTSENDLWTPVGKFELEKGGDNTVSSQTLKGQRFRVVVENKNSPALQFSDMSFQQLEISLKAELSAGVHYSLIFGNKEAAMPDYDLKYFSEQIPAELPVLLISGVQTIEGHKEDTIASSGNDFVAFMWLAIGLVITFLGFMTYKMVVDLGNRNQG